MKPHFPQEPNLATIEETAVSRAPRRGRSGRAQGRSYQVAGRGSETITDGRGGWMASTFPRRLTYRAQRLLRARAARTAYQTFERRVAIRCSDLLDATWPTRLWWRPELRETPERIRCKERCRCGLPKGAALFEASTNPPTSERPNARGAERGARARSRRLTQPLKTPVRWRLTVAHQPAQRAHADGTRLRNFELRVGIGCMR